MLRVEDPRFIVGQGSYIASLRLDGAAHVVYVRSTVAHARIVGMDVSEAVAAPGVVAVVTAADLTDLPPAPPLPLANAAMRRPFLADGVVRFVGEPVVAIVAETYTQGLDAADLVVVDYDPLPVLVDPEDAARGEVLLFPEAGTNVASNFPVLPTPAGRCRRGRGRWLERYVAATRCRRSADDQQPHGRVPIEMRM